MTSVDNRPLRVFLCHSSNDKPAVRELYQKLRAEPWIQPWLDEEELYPGQDWNMEIEKAIEATDVILVCLSNNSITKEGYIQKEIKTALDFADYKPEGVLFIIPVRLEECTPPKHLKRWQYVDYFKGQRDKAIERLLVSLKMRADSLGLIFDTLIEEKPKFEVPTNKWIATNKIALSNGMEFMKVPAGKFIMGSTKENSYAFEDERPQHVVDISYDFWMARYPVTNKFYNDYVVNAKIKHPVFNWDHKKDHPVVQVSWFDSMSYCKWLTALFKTKLPKGLVLRLPTEPEWEKAARGGDAREYPWGDEIDGNKCNISDSGKYNTTPVDYYSPQDESPYGCGDMIGNVWEWTHSLKKHYPYKGNDEPAIGGRIVRGGCFDSDRMLARCSSRYDYDDDSVFEVNGFRMVLSPIIS